MDTKRTVAAYYDQYDEKQRLTQFEGRLEWVRTCEIIGRYLQGGGSTIADIGGAAGAYSFWLQALGNQVHLLDLSEKNLSDARQHAEEQGVALASMCLGDACALPWADHSFDHCLLMGPLYHLLEPEQRLLALSEAKRVTKPGGLLFCAAISRWASLVCAFTDGIWNDPDYLTIVRGDLADGRHVNNTDKSYFTTAYLHDPKELRQEIEVAGLTCQALLSVEGIAWATPGFNEQWDNPAYREVVLEMARRTEADPAIMGVSAHFLAVARR
jgi:ubiquinone/menaquinone biosynthesis C-methylase UbiE